MKKLFLFFITSVLWTQPPEWELNPANYEHVMSVTSIIFSHETSSGDILAAFVDNELRGIAFSDPAPPPLGGGYVFNIMIFSNESSGEILTFKYYNDLSDYVICLSETLEFETDMIIGNALDAYNFNIPSDWLDADLLLPESFIINSAYPNPFNPYVNIEYSIIEPSNIDFYFYSLSGKLIDEINAGFLSKGKYSISWEPENKSSGIYFVVMSNGIEKNMTKITLLK